MLKPVFRRQQDWWDGGEEKATHWIRSAQRVGHSLEIRLLERERPARDSFLTGWGMRSMSGIRRDFNCRILPSRLGSNGPAPVLRHRSRGVAPFLSARGEVMAWELKTTEGFF